MTDFPADTCSADTCSATNRAPVSNPFATRFVRPGAIPYCFGVDSSAAEADARCETLAEQLNLHRAGLIVGPHGTGKSTLLVRLLPRLRQQFAEVQIAQLHATDRSSALECWRHRRRVARRVHALQHRLGDGGLLILDGAEQLGCGDLARLLRRLARHQQAILATSHSPLAGLVVLHQTQLCPELVERLTQHLLDLAPAELRDHVTSDMRARDLTKLSNLRDFWFELYDAVQDRLEARGGCRVV